MLSTGSIQTVLQMLYLNTVCTVWAKNAIVKCGKNRTRQKYIYKHCFREKIGEMPKNYFTAEILIIREERYTILPKLYDMYRLYIIYDAMCITIHNV